MLRDNKLRRLNPDPCLPMLSEGAANRSDLPTDSCQILRLPGQDGRLTAPGPINTVLKYTFTLNHSITTLTLCLLLINVTKRSVLPGNSPFSATLRRQLQRRGVSKSPSFREHDVNRKHVYRVMLYLALPWRCVAPRWDIVPKRTCN